MRRALLLCLALFACQESDDPPQVATQALPLSAEEQALVDRAMSAMFVRDYESVGSHLQPLLERDAPPGDALFIAGSAAYELQRYGEAVTLLSAAVQAKPDFLPTSSALGFAHHKLGAFEESSEAFAAIIAVAPEAYKAHYGLGLVALDQGRLEAARAHLEQALALRPGYLKARFHMARLLHEEKRLEEARDALAAVVEDWPSHEEALYRYARVLSELGDTDGAERVMARHAEVYAGKERIGALIGRQRAGEDSPDVRRQIVTLWLQLGEFDEGLAACSAAIAKFPNDTGLAELKQQILTLR
ncbi:MAG: tetratricopeptide repeat protein [Planctomycetota bacterium]|jgi:tetratricopeptide (TPR) repeat protein